MSNWSGFATTWEKFVRVDLDWMQKRTGVSYDATLKLLTVKSFGQDLYISSKRREVFSDSPEGEFLLECKDFFFDLSTLWYLIGDSEIPLSGNLIKPSDLPGGQIFLQGTHVLPLGAIAEKYNNRKQAFLDRGSCFGGVQYDQGDVGLKLLPFPMIPVYLLLWYGDEEFRPQCQLLLDSSCKHYFSTDVVWAVTTVCCQIFLSYN